MPFNKFTAIVYESNSAYLNSTLHILHLTARKVTLIYFRCSFGAINYKKKNLNNKFLFDIKLIVERQLMDKIFADVLIRS